MKENENITIMRYEIMAAGINQNMTMIEIRESLIQAGFLQKDKLISLRSLLNWYMKIEKRILYQRENKRNLISKCQLYSQK